MDRAAMPLRRRLMVTAEMVAFPHTVFALPFAFLGMILGAGGWPGARRIAWITLAMVGARTMAMAFNRIADRNIDAENPRTHRRPLPSGRLSVAWAAGVMLAAAALFVMSAAMLGRACLALSPLALAIVLGYSWTKRFTWWSHAALGLALAMAPVGAWIAVQGPWSAVPFLLAVAVLTWTAGFDIIYACQDVAFDRGRGLHSVPVRFGVRRALQLSTALHAIMVAMLLAIAPLYGLGLVFLAGVLIAAAVLLHEHRIVRPDDLSRVNTAFFTLNGWVSMVIFLAAAIDLGMRSA